MVWNHFEPVPVAVLTRTIAADGTVGPIAQVAGDDSSAQPAASEAFPDLDGNPKGDAVVAWVRSLTAAPA